MPDFGALDTLTLVSVFAAIGAAALVHGTLGLGFPMVATPLLALLFDVRSAILITLLPTVAVNVVSIARGGNWGDSIGRYWPLGVYAVIGSAIGSGLLLVSSPEPFQFLLAGIILLYLCQDRMRIGGLGWVQEQPRLACVVFGLAAGFSAGTVNVMVPILIILALELNLARTASVQVFNLCFLAGKASQIGVFGSTGAMSLDAAISTTPLVIVALLALAIGMRLRDRIDQAIARTWLRYLLWVMAPTLAIQAGLRLLY